MANLSIVKNIDNKALATTVASPIFPLSAHENLKTGASIAFEVLEKNANGLRTLIGKTMLYVIDGSPFWATLRELTPCTSTVSGLNLMRDEPTFRGVLVVIEEPAHKN